MSYPARAEGLGKYDHVETEQVNCSSLSSPFDPGKKISHLRKTKEFSMGGNTCVCSKALRRVLISCPTWSVIKIDLFSSYEKYQKSSCIICLIRSSDTYMFLCIDLIDFLESLSIIAWTPPRNSEVLFSIERSE